MTRWRSDPGLREHGRSALRWMISVPATPSLTYLKRLPAQVLKIDQSFVRDMLDDPEDLAIVEGVLGLARAFGRRAVAEGAETQRIAGCCCRSAVIWRKVMALPARCPPARYPPGWQAGGPMLAGWPEPLGSRAPPCQLGQGLRSDAFCALDSFWCFRALGFWQRQLAGGDTHRMGHQLLVFQLLGHQPIGFGTGVWRCLGDLTQQARVHPRSVRGKTGCRTPVPPPCRRNTPRIHQTSCDTTPALPRQSGQPHSP